MTFDQVLQVVQVVLVPGIAGLLALVWRAIAKAERAQERAEQARAHSARDLAEYKLEVARSYVTIDYLRDVERRITEHLVRIEEKLDARLSHRVAAGD
ncbi:MAG TPA: hypothetical protein VGN75_18155 [Kaistia sp.]|jgi:outer membrane protein TolC|nr:hypothetical protein [Kaistia sp.]